MIKVTLLFPILNEIDGIKAFLPRIKNEWVDEIVFIDGGSTDGSYEHVRDLGYKIVRQEVPGITHAYQEVLAHVTGDAVVSFSLDGNSIPELIPVVVAKMREGWDMVIVSRYLDGAKSDDDDWLTAFGNWMFTRIVNVSFGGRYSDALVMFRGWRKDIIKSFPPFIPLVGIELLLSIRCAKQKLKVAEIPGDEPRRLGGVRKMRPFLTGSNLVFLILRELVYW
ncbi:MAG: glycosyltransferase family 2 protein [Elusimicrobia bacterium]|nr:glycosyltransferase family 2 protein [Elusimicrobiota bacterium]